MTSATASAFGPPIGNEDEKAFNTVIAVFDGFRAERNDMKRMIQITIVMLLAAAAYAAVDDKFATLVTDAEQRQKVITARAILQNARSTIQETSAQLQEIATSGSFNTVDAELKATLIKAWQVVKDANTGFSDPNVAKLLDWRPEKKK